jgi:exosortase
VLLAFSVSVGWRPLFITLTLSWQKDEYSYIALVLPVSAMLIFADRRRWQSFSDCGVRTGCALILAALTVSCSSLVWPASMTSDIQLSINMFALVLSWIGIFVFCFGIKAFRFLMFPLLFLFGLVPIPRLALNLIIALLENGSAWSAHALFAAFGIPVLHDGSQLTIPGLTLQVAPECSSIRSSSILIVVAVVMAQMLLFTRWRKALVIGFAIPLSVFKNGVRIFTIAMLGTSVDPGYLHGRLHHNGGFLFLGVALFGVFVLIWILRRGERGLLDDHGADGYAEA